MTYILKIILYIKFLYIINYIMYKNLDNLLTYISNIDKV